MKIKNENLDENGLTITDIVNYIENVNMKNGDYDESLKYLIKSLENNPNIAYTLNNIGIFFEKLKDYDKALKYYQKSLEIKAKESVGGFKSIAQMFGKTWDWQRFWLMTASLSLILGFMNLLPIPALDGGYVMFLLWEVFTGKRVSDQFMEKAVTAGFMLLLALIVIINFWDFIR